MENKIICSIGIDHYDIVHYLASTGVALGKRVLVVDLSGDGGVTATVPNAAFTGGAAEYLGVDFSNSAEFLAGHAKDYDYVFTYFDMSTQVIPSWAEEVYVFTDCQKHHLNALSKIRLKEKQYRKLVIRGSIDSKDYRQYALAVLKNFNFDEKEVVEIPFSEHDLNAMLAIQYNGDYHYLGISSKIKDLIYKFYEVDFDEKEITKAIKSLVKRKGGIA